LKHAKFGDAGRRRGLGRRTTMGAWGRFLKPLPVERGQGPLPFLVLNPSPLSRLSSFRESRFVISSGQGVREIPLPSSSRPHGLTPPPLPPLPPLRSLSSVAAGARAGAHRQHPAAVGVGALHGDAACVDRYGGDPGPPAAEPEAARAHHLPQEGGAPSQEEDEE
jgi:hypothetical protein